MKKKLLAGLAVGMMMLGMTGVASASLTTIGQASYNGGNYNLIWDNNNNGNSVVWLDYSNPKTIWANQNAWAAGLNTAGVLNYTLNAGYSVDFGANAWRLPTTVDGAYQNGYNGTTTAGFNITNSEMGHLFYTELGNKGAIDTSGTWQSGWGLSSVGDFDNLTAFVYWSGTESSAGPHYAWYFGMDDGHQHTTVQTGNMSGLAVRSGQVAYNAEAAQTPLPGAVWLLGSGFAGLIGVHRKKRA